MINGPTLETSGSNATGQTTNVNASLQANDTSAFKWDRPSSEKKDPMMSAPGQKAPICASSNGCKVQTAVSPNCAKLNPCLQQLTPPALLQPIARPIHIANANKRPKLQHVQTGISGDALFNSNCNNGDTAMIRKMQQKPAPKNQSNYGAVNSSPVSPVSIIQEKQPQPVLVQDLNTRYIPNSNHEHAMIHQNLTDRFPRIKNLQLSLRRLGDKREGTHAKGTQASSSLNQTVDTSLVPSRVDRSCQPSEASRKFENTHGSSNKNPTRPTKSSIEIELVQQDKPPVRFCLLLPFFLVFPHRVKSRKLEAFLQSGDFSWVYHKTQSRPQSSSFD